jgi:hypothetical protein
LRTIPDRYLDEDVKSSYRPSIRGTSRRNDSVSSNSYLSPKKVYQQPFTERKLQNLYAESTIIIPNDYEQEQMLIKFDAKSKAKEQGLFYKEQARLRKLQESANR